MCADNPSEDFGSLFDQGVKLLKQHYEKLGRPVDFFLFAMDAEEFHCIIVGADQYDVGAQAAAWLQHAESHLRSMKKLQ